MAGRIGKGSEALWLEAAYRALVEGGIEAVRVAPLADALGLSRTSFYGHFASREALLARLLERWREKNTGNLVARCEAYAETLPEALFNLFDCWLDADLFDSRLDRAVRNWALIDPSILPSIENADQTRIRAVTAMFARFGEAEDMARVRAGALYYTQIGYIAMMVTEPVSLRITRMPLYIEVFSGRRPTKSELARFTARHGISVEHVVAPA